MNNLKYEVAVDVVLPRVICLATQRPRTRYVEVLVVLFEEFVHQVVSD